MVFYVDQGAQKHVRARTDFFLCNVPTFDALAGVARPDLMLDNRLAEITTFFTVFSLNLPQSEIKFAPTWDDAVARATKDFVLIQNCGHILYGGDALSVELSAALDACEAATGHIMDRGGYFYLHDQCVLINRRAWEAMGRPRLGTPAKKRAEVAIPERSAENVHDNYTPLWLKPTGRTLPIEASYGYGGEFISAALAAGHTIQNWSAAFRRFKRHCYAYYGDAGEWRAALEDATVAPATEDTQLAQILDFLRKTPNAFETPNWIFVFNSEADDDIPNLHYRNGLDSAFLLASGFKGNRILKTLGFNDNTQIVIYDYSRPALMLREMMVTDWDGRDFAAFFATAREKIDAACGKTYYVPDSLLTDPSVAAREFTREISGAFSSMDEWLAHWARYRRLPHSFVEVDVLRQPEKVAAMVEAHARGNCAIWMSDMFNSPNAVGKFGYARRKQPYDALCARLGERAESYLIIGSEPRPWLPL